MDESMVMVCMQIITNTGSAKSSYIEAIQKAKKGDLGGAEISMNEEMTFMPRHMKSTLL